MDYDFKVTSKSVGNSKITSIIACVGLKVHWKPQKQMNRVDAVKHRFVLNYVNLSVSRFYALNTFRPS